VGERIVSRSLPMRVAPRGHLPALAGQRAATCLCAPPAPFNYLAPSAEHIDASNGSRFGDAPLFLADESVASRLAQDFPYGYGGVRLAQCAVAAATRPLRCTAFGACAVVGSAGSLAHSERGHEIDAVSRPSHLRRALSQLSMPSKAPTAVRVPGRVSLPVRRCDSRQCRSCWWPVRDARRPTDHMARGGVQSVECASQRDTACCDRRARQRCAAWAEQRWQRRTRARRVRSPILPRVPSRAAAWTVA
jgi:hypothetical protein